MFVFVLTSTALSKTRSILNWNVTVKDTFAITQAPITMHSQDATEQRTTLHSRQLELRNLIRADVLHNMNFTGTVKQYNRMKLAKTKAKEIALKAVADWVKADATQDEAASSVVAVGSLVQSVAMATVGPRAMTKEELEEQKVKKEKAKAEKRRLSVMSEVELKEEMEERKKLKKDEAEERKEERKAMVKTKAEKKNTKYTLNTKYNTDRR